MDMLPEYLQIYKRLTEKEKQAFRAAVAADDLQTIKLFIEGYSPEKKRGRGRPNIGLTNNNIKEVNRKKKTLRNIKQPNNFNSDLIERVVGEVVPADDLQTFSELYLLTCIEVRDNFINNNPDRIKKPAYTWIDSLLIEIKKNVPKIYASDAGRVGAAWAAFSELMYSVGLFPTIEAFTTLTNVYMQTLKKELSPQHAALVEKIYNDCKNSMVAQVSYNPYTQVNKMFILKSVYGMQEAAQTKTIEVNHNIRNIEEIPLFNNNNGL